MACFHKPNPANFDGGPGGSELDVQVFTAAQLRADLIALVSNHCLEHSAAVIDRLLLEYKITPLRGRKYP